MARIGMFGNLTFKVSDSVVKTFDGMDWDFSADYATHDRQGRTDLLEFLGPGLDTITFPVIFSVFLGTNPQREINKLRDMVRTGETSRLILGGRVYGSYKWVATGGKAKMQRFDNKGNLWEATVDMTLKEYGKR